jgi:hypothetical protein
LPRAEEKAPNAVEFCPLAVASVPQARRALTPPESAPPSVSVLLSAFPSLLVSNKQSSAKAGAAGIITTEKARLVTDAVSSVLIEFVILISNYLLNRKKLAPLFIQTWKMEMTGQSFLE